MNQRTLGIIALLLLLGLIGALIWGFGKSSQVNTLEQQSSETTAELTQMTQLRDQLAEEVASLSMLLKLGSVIVLTPVNRVFSNVTKGGRAANFAIAILLEAGLSFLGFGVKPPAPSLGNLLNENYGYAIGGKVWLAIIPALSIMLLVLSFNLVGSGLRDAFDVKSSN